MKEREINLVGSRKKAIDLEEMVQEFRHVLNGPGFTIEYSPVPLQFFNISRNYLENQSQGYWKKKREITEEKENNPVRAETTSTGYFRFF